MNEEALNNLNANSFEALDKVINNPEADGLEVLAALLSLPDEDFEALRPIMQEVIISIYDEPQTKLQILQALNESGITINDLINNTDEIAKIILQIDDPQISDSKKDFLQTIFVTMANSLSDSTLNPARLIQIPVEICRENVKLPTYATDGAGAMDIYSPEEVELAPGECKIIPIGIKVAIPHGYGLLIQPRSGLSRKLKLRIPNTPGLIDEDYHEEIGVIVENTDTKIKDIDEYLPSDHFELVKEYGASITIGKGERFAQMRLVEIPRVIWHEVKSIGNFENDHGKGFGSTGEK